MNNVLTHPSSCRYAHSILNIIIRILPKKTKVFISTLWTGWLPFPSVVEFPDGAWVDVNLGGSGPGIFPGPSTLAFAIGVLFWHEGRGVNGGVCPDACSTKMMERRLM